MPSTPNPDCRYVAVVQTEQGPVLVCSCGYQHNSEDGSILDHLSPMQKAATEALEASQRAPSPAQGSEALDWLFFVAVAMVVAFLVFLLV